MARVEEVSLCSCLRMAVGMVVADQIEMELSVPSGDVDSGAGIVEDVPLDDVALAPEALVENLERPEVRASTPMAAPGSLVSTTDGTPRLQNELSNPPSTPTPTASTTLALCPTLNPTPSHPPPSKTTLLTLPNELISQILAHLLISPHPILIVAYEPSTRGRLRFPDANALHPLRPSPAISLFLTCKALHADALHFFYAHNTFCITRDIFVLETFTNSLTPAARTAIRTLRLAAPCLESLLGRGGIFNIRAREMARRCLKLYLGMRVLELGLSWVELRAMEYWEAVRDLVLAMTWLKEVRIHRVLVQRKWSSCAGLRDQALIEDERFRLWIGESLPGGKGEMKRNRGSI